MGMFDHKESEALTTMMNLQEMLITFFDTATHRGRKLI